MVNAVVAVVTKALKKGESVQITGFGTFEVAKRAARKGRNPATGKEIKIPASKAPKFKAGAVLKKSCKVIYTVSKNPAGITPAGFFFCG